MVNWKIIVTGIIILVLILVVMTTQPSFSQFFGKVTGKVTNIAGEGGRVTFSMSVGAYDISSSAVNANVIVDTPEMNAKLGDNEVTAQGEISLEGFTGRIMTEGSSAVINGSISKIISSGLTLTGSQNFETTVSFASLSVKNVSISKIETDSAKMLKVNSIEISPEGKAVMLDSVLGEINYKDGETTITGTAKSFKIPEAGISIS